MAEYEISHPRIPQIGNLVLEGPDDLPPPTEQDFWNVVHQQVRPIGLSQLTDEEKVSAYKNGYFNDPEPVEGQPEQPGMIDSLLDLGGKAVLRGSQMANVLTAGTIGHSGPYDKLLKLQDKAVPYEKTENADQFREAGKYLFGFLDNTEEELDFDPVAEALKRTGMPFYSKNKNARGRVKTAAMDYAQDSMVAGMGEGYARAASGGEFLYKGGKFLKDKLLLDEADDSDILDYVNSSIEFDALNHRYENSAELAAFVLENPQESVKAMGAGIVGGLTPIVEAEDLNEILIDEEDINLDSDLQQDIRSGFVQPDVGVSFLSEVVGDPMNLAGGTTAKAVTAPQRVALSGKITQTLNEVTQLNQGKGMALRALEKFPEDSLIAQRQAKFLEAANQSLAQKQKVLDKYARNSMFLRMAAQSSPDELLKVAAKNIDTASDAGKASMNMVYNAMKPNGKIGLIRKGVAMGARLTPEIAGATIGAYIAGPEGAAVGAITPSLIKSAKIISTMPENVAISYIMRSATEAGEEITEQVARKQWRGITKYLYPTGILGIGIGAGADGRESGETNPLLKFGAVALGLKTIPKLAKFGDAAMRDSRIIGPELIYARGSEASPFFNRLALLPSADEGLIGANADRFQALTRTSSGETLLEKAIDKVRPIGRGIATSVTDEFPTGAPFRPGLSDTNKMLSNPTRKAAQFLDRTPALGRNIETLGRFGTVVTAGSTLPAAFGYVGSGGQAEGALAGALVSAPFTSIGAGAGMFQSYKNKSDLFQQKMGDVYYYREHLNKKEQAEFDNLPIHLRMALAGASLSHPDILILPDKEGQGSWQFNPETKTSEIRYNPETGEGLIDGLLSHEIGHHIEIHGLTPIINKLYFGDPLTKEGGVYGKFDDEGKIVPNEEFNKLREFYLEKLSRDDSISFGVADQYQGERGIEIMASELFAETVRDYLKSGKKNKGNTSAKKLITAASEAMIGTPFIRDFLLKLNLPMKADGKFIEGGFFEGKLRRIPELSKLIDQYYSDTRAMRQREIQGEEITTPGSGKIDKELSIDSRKAKRPIDKDDHQSSFSLEDQNNPAIRAKLNTGGIFKWRPTSDGKGAELELGPGGAPKRYTPGELKKEQRAQGDHAVKVFKKNGIEIITHKDGSKSTSDITNLTPEIIDELAAGPWHPRQIQTLREISRSLREGDGERAGFLIGYFAASKGRKPKPVPFSLRQEMPYGFKLTKDGNILILLHDVPQLEKNLRYLKSNKVPSKFRNEYNELFKGDDNQVWADFKQYRINTANGLNGELGLDPNLSKAIRKKNFLNALHGAIDQEHINLNPILSEIKNSAGFDMFNPSPRQAFGPATKTFRLDRIFDVTRSGNMNSNINLDRAKRLLMPRQSKNFDKKVALRTNEDIIKQIDILAEQKGVSRNDLLNEILRDRVTEKTPDDSGIPVDSENVPPITEKEFQNLKDQSQKKSWSEDSDQDLNWLRNEPRDRLFMPAVNVEQRRAEKYGKMFQDAVKSDKEIIAKARRDWMENGFKAENFQAWITSGLEKPALAREKNGIFEPIKLYYGGPLGMAKRPGFNPAAPLEILQKSEYAEGITRKADDQYTSDKTIILTDNKNLAKQEQESTYPGVKPLEFATNANFIFDPLYSQHLELLKKSIRDIEPDSPELAALDQLSSQPEDIYAYENLLKQAGWDGYRIPGKDGDGFAIFDAKKVKLIADQAGEGKFFTKDRPYGKVSGLFGRPLPSEKMSSMGSRSRGSDVRFMPQMELDFDVKSQTARPTEQSSQGISFWKLFGIDKNDKEVYKKVAKTLINTGSPDMDPQTALDYSSRLGLDVKRLRQEMEKAQARYRRENRLYMPKSGDYMHKSGGLILPDGSFIKKYTDHNIDLFEWVKNNPKNPFAQKMEKAEKMHKERNGKKVGFHWLENGLREGAIRIARDSRNSKNIYIESRREIPSRLKRELIDQAMMAGNTLILDRGSREQVIFDPGNKLFMPTAYHGTPHTFSAEPGAPLGRFRTSAIGSGEGAQAYGHGLYFSSKQAVAEFYKSELEKKVRVKPEGEYRKYLEDKIDQIDAEFQITQDFVEDVINSGRHQSQEKDPKFQQILKKRRILADKKIDLEWQLRGKKVGTGSVYKVELAPKDNEYLLYDKTLGEQPKGVQDKLKKFLREQEGEDTWQYRQEQDYRDITNNVLEDMPEPEISRRLKEAGIPGIKYLDGSSRSKGKGDYNYVIFDEADVQITDKLFMPASEAGAGKGKQAEAAKLWQEKGTDSPYFKKWFGKSKVVDENGEPLVVYHGSIEPNIQTFDLRKAVEVEGGIFFSDDIGVADQYTYERAYGDIISDEPLGDVTEAYLSFQNPLEYKLKPNQQIVDAVEMTRAIKSAKEKGHDGLVVRNIDDSIGMTGDISDIYVAFSPEQIKSATGNRGTFDAGERNINYMPSDPKAPARQPANRIQQQAPAMPGNRFMAPAASAGAKLSERFR
jgi:predicted HicB family RNase H-like nuclease